MNDIENDWIDDMLQEDFPEYDDLTEENLSDTNLPEFSWKASHLTHLPQLW